MRSLKTRSWRTKCVFYSTVRSGNGARRDAFSQAQRANNFRRDDTESDAVSAETQREKRVVAFGRRADESQAVARFSAGSGIGSRKFKRNLQEHLAKMRQQNSGFVLELAVVSQFEKSNKWFAVCRFAARTNAKKSVSYRVLDTRKSRFEFRQKVRDN